MAKRILIIDDSASLRGMVKLVLQNGGYDVTEACDGLDALDKLTTAGRVNLMICDVNMPRMDGLAFVKAVKEIADHKFSPVVMLTTEASAELVARGKAAGAKAWMVKPFQPEQLLAVVGKLVGS
jgi:two-component system chemotaxis response regulator CheY